MPGRSQSRKGASELLRICCSLSLKRKKGRWRGSFSFQEHRAGGVQPWMCKSRRDALVCQARAASLSATEKASEDGNLPLVPEERAEGPQRLRLADPQNWLAPGRDLPCPLPHMATEQLAARSLRSSGFIFQRLEGDGQSPSPLVCLDGWGVPEVGATHHGTLWDCEGTQLSSSQLCVEVHTSGFTRPSLA